MIGSVSSPNWNLEFCLKKLLSQLDFQVTDHEIENFRHQRDYPAMVSLSDVLSDWNIKSLIARIPIEKVADIPLPALSLIHRNTTYIVLKEFKNDFIRYYNERGEYIEHISEFREKWSGIVLLVDSRKEPSDVKYNEKVDANQFETISIYLLWILVGALIFFTLFFVTPQLLSLYAVKIAGLVVCIALIRRQFGTYDHSIDFVCRIGVKFDCNAVIHSGYRLFGQIYLSELGLLYFIGTISGLIIYSLIGTKELAIVKLLNISVLPFTILATYYQLRIIKKWCLLCIIVMIILWLEFVIGLLNLPGLRFSIDSAFILLFSFTVPAAVWLSMRKRFIASMEVGTLNSRLTSFLRNEDLFQYLLNKQPIIQSGCLESDMILGNPSAPVEITLVTNPSCHFCGQVHSVLETFPKWFDGNVKFKLRFFVNLSERNSDAYKMLCHLINLALTNRGEDYFKAVSSWFSKYNMRDFEKWRQEYPIANYDERAERIANQHFLWCSNSGLKATPTVLINGRKVPEEFTALDLKFHLMHLVEPTK